MYSSVTRGLPINVLCYLPSTVRMADNIGGGIEDPLIYTLSVFSKWIFCPDYGQFVRIDTHIGLHQSVKTL